MLPVTAVCSDFMCFICFFFPSLHPSCWIDKAMSMNRLPPTASRGFDQSSASESESPITSTPTGQPQEKTMAPAEKLLPAHRTTLTNCLWLKTSLIMCDWNFTDWQVPQLYCVWLRVHTVPLHDSQLYMCVCVCVVSVIVKHPVLPPCTVDGRSRNPLYYYYRLRLFVLIECVRVLVKTICIDVCVCVYQCVCVCVCVSIHSLYLCTDSLDCVCVCV